MKAGGGGAGRGAPTERRRGRSDKPLIRQAIEGIGVVVLVALGAIVTGLALSVLIAIVF